ncbi:MAG: hypothetical protein EXS35_11935 [Pedosphaera sp.]|nr:hypothetical protein [Pedosphaera sp.]
MKRGGQIGIALLLVAFATLAAETVTNFPKADGYRGIWYFNQASNDEYRYKYSGGFATYPQQHAPIAIYCEAVKKTFFVYGGTTATNATDRQQLLHMVSFYDHATGTVPRPTILLNKKTDDAHDNPVLSVDDNGFLWIFSPSHGTGRPSFIHRSAKPYSIDAFERVVVTNFSYPQPWFLAGQGFLFLQTRYNAPGAGKAARGLHFTTSTDGRSWSAPALFAAMELGDYQISWPCGSRVGTAFDFHPAPLGLNGRANVYYAETADFGRTWQTATGTKLTLPLTNVQNAALVYDSRAEKLLVYLKDVNYDASGRPVILFLTSPGYESGPKNGPRTWRTAHWTGKEWKFNTVTTSDNNYDHGSLYIEPDGAWRIIAPTEAGPQPFNPGGEMVMWLSRDAGNSWKRVRQLTSGSSFNHTYARRPLNAQPDFYALWADGHGRQPSESRLYFTTRDGDRVGCLPARMDGEFARPELIRAEAKPN